MVHFKVSSTAAFYQSCSPFFTYLDPPRDGVGEMEFLALYQMGRTIPRYLDAYQKNVRVRSRLWDETLGTCFDVAQFASDHLELVEILGSYAYDEGQSWRGFGSVISQLMIGDTDVAPYIIHAKIIGEEVEAKLQFDHVNAASRLDGYRRSLLYRSVNPTGSLPYVILLHEFDSDPGNVAGVQKDMEGIEPSQDCAFQLRSFKLLDAEGFDGECRRPERL